MEQDLDGIKTPYVCHLCDFAAQRITGLDRHILTKHNIGIDTLMELMLTKIKSDIVNKPEHEKYIPNVFRSDNEKGFLLHKLNSTTPITCRNIPYYNDVILSCAQTKMDAMKNFHNLLDTAEKANKELMKIISNNEYLATRNTNHFTRAKLLQDNVFNKSNLNSTETQTFTANKEKKYCNNFSSVSSETSEFSSDDSCETLTTSSDYENRRRIYCCFLCRYITKYRINYWNHMKKFHKSYIQSTKKNCDCT